MTVVFFYLEKTSLGKYYYVNKSDITKNLVLISFG